MTWHCTTTVSGEALDELDIAVCGHIDELMAGNEADRKRGAGLEEVLRNFMQAITGRPQIYNDIVDANDVITELNADCPSVECDEHGGVIHSWN